MMTSHFSQLARQARHSTQLLGLLPIFVYLLTFKVSLLQALLGLACFLLITLVGRLFLFFRVADENPILQWVLQSFFGLGLFQFIWLAAKLVRINPLPLLVLCAAAALFLEARYRRGKPPQKSLSRRDLVILALILLFALAITTVPFAHFGKLENGTYHYRFSFNAATTKNFAVINLMDRDFPFENPFFKGEPFHFYYLSYVFPAALKQLGMATQEAFFVFQAIVGYLFILLLFCFFRFICGRLPCSAVLTFIALFTASTEGFYFIAQHFRLFLANPLFFRSLNHFDGITFIYFGAPLVDTLHRAVLFSVTSVQALAFLLIGLMLLKMGRKELAPPFMLFSIMASFFIGGIGFLFLSIYLLFDRGDLRDKKKYALMLAICGLVGMGLLKVLNMLGQNPLKIVWLPLDSRRLFWSLLLNFGLVLPLGLIGLLLAGKKGKERFFHFLLAISLIALFLAYFIRIEPINDDVPNKLSMVLQVLLVAGLLPFIRMKKLFWTAVIAITVTGLPTYLGGLYSYQDYRDSIFVLRVPAEEMIMSRWIARNTPENAIVQTFPSVREDYFSLAPVFAERGMAVGDSVHGLTFLVSRQEYSQRLARVEQALTRINDPEAVVELRRLGIDYILWGKRESEVMPRPRHLRLIYRVRDAHLYAIQ